MEVPNSLIKLNKRNIMISELNEQDGNNSPLIGSQPDIQDVFENKSKKFLIKLFEMTNDETTNEIICWMDESDGFQILDMDRFCNELLPKYFKHNKFSSFIRQLNMYDFQKQRGNGYNFSHSHFIKGSSKEHIISSIERKTNLKHEKNAEKLQHKMMVK